MRRTGVALLLASLACADDVGAPSTGTTSDTTTLDAPQPEAQGADTTSGGPEAGCIDDYQGNQGSLAAHALGLDTTANAVVSLGDGHAATPAESGDDVLAVCAATPSDFFVLEAPCASYLAVEVRALEGGVPELRLHDDAGQVVEQALGDWHGFFLKPLQRPVGPGSHVIEVRHAGGGPQRYGLTVIVLPGSPCGA